MEMVAKVFGDKIGRPDLKYVQFTPQDAKKGMMDFPGNTGDHNREAFTFPVVTDSIFSGAGEGAQRQSP